MGQDPVLCPPQPRSPQFFSRSLIDRINWQQKMKSSVAQIKHSSGHDRRENNSSYQRTISPEDRYAKQERSPRDRDYFGYSRSDNERSRRGRSYDGSMESRSRDREKEKEMWIRKGTRNLHRLGEEAQNHR
ncbi:Pre-mRNA-splicing factor CWC22 like protein [Myotis brandtii]|uniref:Pre-mRNA-splicing factor CWC22 like protein n=1 Tax=Myotis brandtii TaxID=109478 RepID=S7P4J9_MYOBR|nr:Pre-mRNA-splicing factor CWC22 like protein [Myotis brandtii]